MTGARFAACVAAYAIIAFAVFGYSHDRWCAYEDREEQISCAVVGGTWWPLVLPARVALHILKPNDTIRVYPAPEFTP